MFARRHLKIVGAVVAALVLLACGGVLYLSHSWAERSVHPPRSPVEQTPADHGLAYEPLTLTTEDGLELASWYIRSQNRAAVIVLPGIGGDRETELYAAQMLARHGYGAVLLDLRATGESGGDTRTWGLHEVRDVEAACRYLKTRPDVDAERIGALGQSFGGVVALLHAARSADIRAVAAQGAYTSMEDMVATGVQTVTGLPPFPFAPLILWFAEREGGFDSDALAPVEVIAAISPRPVFLMQGGRDAIVPPDSGQRLYEAAGEPRELWFEPDLGHGVFGFERAELFEERVVGFFNQYLLETEMPLKDRGQEGRATGSAQ